MSVKVMSWVFEHSAATLGDRLVLLAIADHANNEGLDAFPSVDTIAKKARVDRSTVFRSIERLVALGELKVQSGGGRGHTNAYSVTMEQSHIATDKKGRNMRPCPPETVASEAINGRNEAEKTVAQCDPNLKRTNTNHAGARARDLQSVRDCLANATPTATYGKKPG